MSEKILLGFIPQGTEWLLILLVIVLLFGASRLPQLAKSLGQSKRAFREGMDEAEEEARLKSASGKGVTADKASLKAVDDEELFDEARRRASRLRAGETATIEEGKLTSDKSRS
jgi:sec-independent protein translocase protein TatA